MKLKEEYKNKNIFHNGIKYELTNISEEKLKMIYDNTPALRHIFEVECPFELPDLTEEEEEQDLEKSIKDFFQHKPEEKTEEEFFNETIKKATKRKPKQ
jgi:hypothetical protein